MNSKQKHHFIKMKKEFDNRCLRCGLKGYHLDNDHIVPQVRGGSDHPRNMQPLCAWCNAIKNKTENWKIIRRKIGWIPFKIRLSSTHPFNKSSPYEQSLV